MFKIFSNKYFFVVTLIILLPCFGMEDTARSDTNGTSPDGVRRRVSASVVSTNRNVVSTQDDNPEILLHVGREVRPPSRTYAAALVLAVNTCVTYMCLTYSCKIFPDFVCNGHDTPSGGWIAPILGFASFGTWYGFKKYYSVQAEVGR